MEGGDCAEWFFIGTAEEVGTQTLSVDVQKTTSATQTEVAATVIEAASLDQGGRALWWMLSFGGFLAVAGAVTYLYQRKTAGANPDRPRTAEETVQEGTQEVAKFEEPVADKQQQISLKEKDWLGAMPTLPALEPFVAPAKQSQIQAPGPNLQPNERYESLPRNQDQVMPTAEADMKEDTLNQKMALAFAASLFLIVAGFKTRCLLKRANVDLLGNGKAKQVAFAPAKPDPATVLPTKPVLRPPFERANASGSPGVVDFSGDKRRGFELAPENICNANMEILQKSKQLSRNSATAEVRVADGVVRPAPPTSCHIFRILPKQ